MTDSPLQPSDECVAKLKILADATRLTVVRALLPGGQRVAELNRILGIDASLLSHHLRVLREAGIVVTEREGRFLRYRLATGMQDGPAATELQLGCCVLRFRQRTGAGPCACC